MLKSNGNAIDFFINEFIKNTGDSIRGGSY